MRSRRGDEAPVSFFSFQDVLLSLIGITIVITMILFLQITQAAVSAVEAMQAGPDGRESAVEVERLGLGDEIAILEAAIRQAQERPDVDPLARRTTLRAELLSARDRMETLRLQQEELERQLRALTLLSPQAGELREIAELASRRDLLADELATLERRRRISFIVDTAQAATPFLLEISDARIVFTELGADAAALRISAGTADARVRDAFELFRRQSKGREAYLLVVLKPSGITSFRKLRELIRELPASSRPAIGLELIPEHSHVAEVFPSAPGGSS